MLDTTLEKLGLRDEEIKMFLFLLEHGGLTAGELAKKTGLPRPSLYGFARKLEDVGLIVESLKNGVKTFIPVSQEAIQSIFDDRIKDLERDKIKIKMMFTELNAQAIQVAPKFQLFEGAEGVKHVLRDMLLYRDIETKAYWPIKATIGLLGEEFFRKLNAERIKRHIYTRGIWPQSQRVDLKTHTYMGVGDGFFREIRIAPEDIHFSMGYWIYESKVAFVSSKKESFGFIIESREFVEMLSSQFEVIWNVSKTLDPEPDHTNEFLKTIN